MTITINKNELFGWFIGENINFVYNKFVEIYYDNQLILAGEFNTVIDNIDVYYLFSTIKEIVKNDNVLKFYLIH